MSKGLGKTQRAILDALVGQSYCTVNDLAARVFHADRYPPAELADSDWLEYMRQCGTIPVTRSQYVSTFRAVQALERAGLVTTEICIPKPIMGYLPPSAVRWKAVRLSVDSHFSLSTLRSTAS